MTGSDLKKRLQNGGVAYGTMLSCARNPRWASAISSLKFDYVIIDNEHSPYSRGETADMIFAINAIGVTPIVRVPVPDSHYVTMAIDAGAHGVLAPYCETVDQVKEVIGAAKWRPLKWKLVDHAIETGEFPSDDSKRYLENINSNSFVMIGIESVPAVENLDKILEIEGIDVIFVGPNDISISLGVPNQYDHPKFENTLKLIIEKCTAKNIPVAAHFQNLDLTRKWIREGVKFVLHLTDRGALNAGYRHDFDAIRKTVSEVHDEKLITLEEAEEVI